MEVGIHKEATLQSPVKSRSGQIRWESCKLVHIHSKASLLTSLDAVQQGRKSEQAVHQSKECISH